MLSIHSLIDSILIIGGLSLLGYSLATDNIPAMIICVLVLFLMSLKSKE